MPTAVQGEIHHFEVFNPIVVLDTVLVVNRFVAFEFPSEMLFHDETMPIDPFALNLHSNVGVRFDHSFQNEEGVDMVPVVRVRTHEGLRHSIYSRVSLTA